MPLPDCLDLTEMGAFRQYYVDTYCRGVITCYDGMRVYFSPRTFDHAFFESSGRRGEKDIFSTVRASRLPWIAATLAHPDADRLQGWVAKERRYDPTRRVEVVYDDFVVILAIRLAAGDLLKGQFITCYQADNSIAKIRQSPTWDRDACLNSLK